MQKDTSLEILYFHQLFVVWTLTSEYNYFPRFPSSRFYLSFPYFRQVHQKIGLNGQLAQEVAMEALVHGKNAPTKVLQETVFH